MAEQDYYLKRLFGNSERFADFYNGTVFAGQQVLKAQQLTDVPVEKGITVVGPDGKRRLLERKRDVIKKASFGAFFVLLAEENQAGVHYAMPVRNMMYDALEYTEQVEALRRLHKKRGDRLEGDEFLSGIAREDRLLPVITLTVYHGKRPWDGPRSLYEMLDLDKLPQEAALLKSVLPDYRLNLVELEHMDHPERFRTSLQHVFTVLKYNKDKKQLYDYVEKHRTELQRMDDDSMRAMLALMGEQKRLMKRLETPGDGREERMDMSKAIDDLIADGRAEGMAKGIMEGRTEGAAQVNILVTKLAAQGRMDDIVRAAADMDYQRKLFEEFGI